MLVDTTICPSADDKPTSYLGGTAHDIPVLDLDRRHGSFRLQFRPNEFKTADDYLTALVHAAQDLQDKVRIAMQNKS